MDCPNCGNNVPADAEACPACGHLHASATCTTHPDHPAEGVCVVCGMALCDECDRGQGTAYLCEAHQAVPVTEGGWVEAYSTGDDLEAELVRDNLQAEGIDAQVLSSKDHYAVPVDLGDLARVRVLVPAPDYDEARSLLEAQQTEGGVQNLPVTCPACGAAYEPGDVTCAACGASLVESTGA